MKRLFTNATFVTMRDARERAEALLVDDDGTIAYVGDLGEARSLAQGAPETDLHGACVLPGFIDPHSHFTGALQYLLYADLSQCTSFAQIEAVLKEFAASRPVGGWRDREGAWPRRAAAPTAPGGPCPTSA